MKNIFLLWLLFTTCTVHSQQEIKLNTDKPENVNMSSEKLNRINSLMQQYVDEKKLPGMITMVARHGKVVHFEKYGVMDESKPMQYNTIFRLASMTKPVTSVAVMILFEERHFQLDDPIDKFIPEFKNVKVFSGIEKDAIHTVDAMRPITIRDLLTHTSGLSGVGADSPVDSMYSVANLSDGTLKEMIHKLSEIPLLYQPGTRWNYSRSTDVLGYLVEVISGKQFDTFLKERVFKPLKMNDTGFYVAEEKIDRVAAVYAPDTNGIKVIMKPDISNISTPVTFLSGNGGLVSTAADYMIFSQMLLNKGEYFGVRILQSKTIDLMTSNQLSCEIMPDDDFFGPLLSGMGYGLGFAIVRDSTKTKMNGTKGSYWWSGSGNTYFYIDPREDLVLIFMTQFVPNFYYPILKQLVDLGYEAINN